MLFPREHRARKTILYIFLMLGVVSTYISLKMNTISTAVVLLSKMHKACHSCFISFLRLAFEVSTEIWILLAMPWSCKPKFYFEYSRFMLKLQLLDRRKKLHSIFLPIVWTHNGFILYIYIIEYLRCGHFALRSEGFSFKTSLIATKIKCNSMSFWWLYTIF